MGKIRKNGSYCAYLRKSRADLQEEARGLGETLARHEQLLTELAARLEIPILQTYREIVSGDTIAERPAVRQLLNDIGAGRWDGVLVVDVDRLGRGDSIDQGIIMQTFLYSGTLIVTPDKTYDPADDADAEFFEIKLFFSRREYSMIKKRMQRGRLQSAMDGCYMGSRPVYGYERYKLPHRKGWSLRIVPDKAAYVRMIFDWYINGISGKPAGAMIIADKLNGMGLLTDMGNRFEPSYIRQILTNPAYIGKVRWNQRTTVHTIENGLRVKSRQPCDNALLVDGLHEPIIDTDTWNRAQAIFATHAHRPKPSKYEITNPFAGLAVCSACGRAMIRKPDPARNTVYLCCVTQHCPTFACSLDVVENAVLETLELWIGDYEAAQQLPPAQSNAAAEARKSALDALLDQRRTALAQIDRLYDLLEQKLYTPDIYRQRRDALDERLKNLDASIADLKQIDKPNPLDLLIPRVRSVVNAYGQCTSGAEKNKLLKSVVSKIVYTKNQRCYRNNDPSDYLSVEVYPNIPTD